MATVESLRLEIDARGAKRGAREFEQEIDRVKRAVLGLVGVLSAGVIGRRVVNDLATFQTALVSVGKTTNILGQDLERLGSAFIAMSNRLPVTATELLGIASAAGQVGVTGERDLLAFSEVVAKLGATTNLAGEEAAVALARMLGVTGEATSEIGKLGDVLAALGNNAKANEREILHVAQQVALATNRFKVSSVEATALGAALAEMGIRAELSASALGRTFRALDGAVRSGGATLDLVSDIAGTSREEFVELFGRSSTQAFLAFNAGLGEFIRQGGDASEVMGQLGLTGEELERVLPSLAGNAARVGEVFAIMAQQARDGGALNEEFARASDTLAGSFKLLRNAIGSYVDGLDEVRDALKSVVDFSADVVRELLGQEIQAKELRKAVEDAAIGVKILTAAFAGLVAVQVASLVVSWVNPITAAASAIAALAVGVVGLGIHYRETTLTIRGQTAELQDFVLGAWDTIKQAGVLAFDVLAGAFDVMQFYVPALFGRLVDEAIAAFDAVRNGARTLAEAMGTDLESVFDFLGDVASGVANHFIASFHTLRRVLADFARDAIDVLQGLSLTAGGLLDFAQTRDPLSLNTAALGLRQTRDALAELVDPKRFSETAQIAGEEFGTDFVGGFAKAVKREVQLVLAGIEATVPGFKSRFGDLLDLEGTLLANVDARSAARQAARALEEFNAAFFRTAEIEAGIVASLKGVSAAAGSGAGGGSGGAAVDEDKLRGQEALLKAFNAAISDSQITTDAFKFLPEQRQIEIQVERFLRDAEAVGLPGAEELAEKMRETFEEELAAAKVDALAQSLSQSFGAAINDILTGVGTVEDALQRLVQNISAQLIDQLITQQIVGGLTGLLGGLLGGIFGGGAGAAAGFGPIFATGGVFDQGRVVPFASGGLFGLGGGLIDAPTMFPLRGGNTGLAGEAGPEAIVPLKRGAGGRLGIEGGGGTTVVHQTFNVRTPDVAGFNRSRRQIMSDMQQGLR